MAANVINSSRTIQMSGIVVRAFVKMRSFLTEHRELAKQLADLESRLTGRLDTHEIAIVEVLQRTMTLLDPLPPPPEPPKQRIGFERKATKERWMTAQPPKDFFSVTPDATVARRGS
jgi:hypothetical protein